jgi:thioredoxin reductase (NADPH)
MADEAVYDFDLFVIGGGSGGLACAKQAASLGVKVGLADFVTPSPQGTTYGLGGTCVNVGCIPKKLLHIAAHRAETLREAHEYGFEGPSREGVVSQWEKLITSINMYIRKLNWNYKTELRNSNVKFYNAFATFADAHTLELKNKAGAVEKVTAKFILVATGGRPSLGGYPGAEECCISSDDIFWQKTAPGKTLVVGASYIALECAGFLAGLGYDTTVMVRSILLRGFDQDIADRIGGSLERRGVAFVRETVPSRFEKAEDGKKIVFVKDPSTGVESEFGRFDTVLMAVGRTGTANSLNLEAVGVEYKKSNGKIKIDNSQDRTNVENIFAIGDVVDGRIELTPPAIFAGKLLADRLFAYGSETLDYNNIATTVFTPVEYGCVGVTEDQAKELYPYSTVYHKVFQPLDDVLIIDKPNDECYMKVIAEPTEGRLVGIHFYGPHAGEVIQGLAVAMKAGCTKHDLDNTIGIHPTNAEQFVSMSLTQVKEDGVELEANGGC